jgi:hypothetical protein
MRSLNEYRWPNWKYCITAWNMGEVSRRSTFGMEGNVNEIACSWLNGNIEEKKFEVLCRVSLLNRESIHERKRLQDISNVRIRSYIMQTIIKTFKITELERATYLELRFNVIPTSDAKLLTLCTAQNEEAWNQKRRLTQLDTNWEVKTEYSIFAVFKAFRDKN